MPPTSFDPPRIFNRGAHVFAPGGTARAADSTWRTFDNDTVAVDTDGFWSAGAPSRLTIPSGADGNYFIWAGPQWNDPHFTIKGRILANGSPVGIEPTTDGFIGIPSVALTDFGGPLVFHLAALSAGDYVEAQGWSDGGGTPNSRTQIGLVESPSNQACLLLSTTPQASGTSYAVATYSSALFDPHGMRSGNTIVIQEDGWYVMLSSIASGGEHSIIQKNGSGVPINGSYAQAPSGFGHQDFCVDFLEAGDVISHLFSGDPGGGSADITGRELLVFKFGEDPTCNFAYAYPSVDTYNTGTFPDGFQAAVQCGGEFFDTGGGSPYHGKNYDFGLLEGLHLGICKLDSQGAGASNQTIQTRLNEVDYLNYWTSSRNGAYDTTQITIAFMEADACDYFTFRAILNDTNVRYYYAVKTNCFATDVCSCEQQIYRRLEVDPE